MDLPPKTEISQDTINILDFMGPDYKNLSIDEKIKAIEQALEAEMVNYAQDNDENIKTPGINDLKKQRNVVYTLEVELEKLKKEKETYRIPGTN